MKIAFAQTNPRVGDVCGNLKEILKHIEDAKKVGARLIVFPELAITGYPPRDFLEYGSFVQDNLLALKSLEQSSKELAIVIGYVDINKNGTGKPYRNCAAFLDKGTQVGSYTKQLLPYYDVFEEERFFEPGSSPGVLNLDGNKIGVTICEDIWNSEEYIKRLYSKDPLAEYAPLNLDVLINLSASPFHVGKPETRLSLAKEITSRTRCPLVFCNQTGANDELIFDGSSFAMRREGVVASRVTSFSSGVGLFDLESGDSDPAHYPADSNEWIAQALTLGIRDYVRKSGSKKVCLGLSGGIDSAVVACLAVNAVGKENVSVLSMPSQYSSKDSQSDALTLARALGVDCKTLSIDNAYQSLIATLGIKLTSLTQENIQPRIRMTLLMAHSNETGALVLNTSNKSELAAGFATQYGDSAGALSVIGDLKKSEVYSLGRFLNQSMKVIPEAIFTRVPTAELKENQKDEDVLPPYGDLDSLVVDGVEQFRSFDEILKSGMRKESLEIFRRMYSTSEYKRRQFPPVLRVSEKAFGMGRRMPVAARFPF